MAYRVSESAAGTKMHIGFDVIGDIHGELPALKNLAIALGYNVKRGWRHPNGRILVFLGDLVDRGMYSIEVAELVRSLVAERRAFCIMGNHEYNLAAYHLKVPGYEKPKSSNSRTIKEIQKAPEKWGPILEWFRDLPIGIELPELRIIHACWHRQSLEQVRRFLARSPDPITENLSNFDLLSACVVLRSPFTVTKLIDGLPGDTADRSCVIPHEDLMTGFEIDTPEPFYDNDGKLRTRIRSVWWKDGQHLVLNNKTQVFGHYWNCPPLDGNIAPPFPSGHPQLRAWSRDMVNRCPPSGRMQLKGDFVCVDFQGITLASDKHACIGALRWPEREIVWESGPKTSATPKHRSPGDP